MKIGIIIDFIDEPTNGGGFSYLSLFVSKLISTESRHEFVILSSYEEERVRKSYNIPQKISFIKLRKSQFFFIKQLSKWSKKSKVFSGLHSFLEEYLENLYHKFFKKTGIQSLCYLPYNKIYTLDIPFFYIVWDIGHRNINEFPEVSHKGQFAYREHIYNTLLPRAYRIIAETESGKKDIEYYYRIKPEKIVVAPMFAGDVIRQSYNIEEGTDFLKNNNIEKGKYLFYPAQFWAHKNHVNLLYALKSIHDKHPSLNLVLCGSDKGNLSFVLSSIKKMNLQNQVKILGFVKELKDLRILYENAFVLVMPTFLGPSNMPILEAMALKCAVICSDFEGHRELGGEHLVYIKPEDPSSIAEAIIMLMDDPNRREKMIDDAKKHYEESNNHIDKLTNILLVEFDKFEAIRRCWD